MKNLVTPITIPNVTKWKVVRFAPYLDDTPAWGELTIQFQGGGSIVYATRVLPIFDAQDSMYVFLNPTSASYTDKLSTGMKTVAGAFTVLLAASQSGGNRNAQLQAVETACLSTGIVDASLAST